MAAHQLPIIDIGPLFERSPSKDGIVLARMLGELRCALQDSGFFYIKNHGIPSQMIEDLATISREFFRQPLDYKMSIAMEKAGLAWRGYFPPGGELTSGRPDRKEGVYFGRELSWSDPRVRAGLPLHGANLWPEGAIGLKMKTVVLDYMARLTELGHLLMEGIALSLGLERGYFRERFSGEPTTLFRIFNYAEHTWTSTEDEWGVREHTDYGFLTILHQDSSGGLEVQTRAGEWVSAPPIKDTFVINIGDMLELWTHGLYRSTPHRVHNQAKGDRISMPFFFDPEWNCSLKPIPGLTARHDTGLRWDGARLEELPETMNYGDYLGRKVAKVFPELAAQRAAKGDV